MNWVVGKLVGWCNIKYVNKCKKNLVRKVFSCIIIYMIFRMLKVYIYIFVVIVKIVFI